MSFAHEAIAANPVVADADKALQRALFTRRYTYNLSAAELASDFVAVDPATGVLPLYLRQNNVTYQYDSTDSTTAFGAGVCLVTSDGKRYKAETIEYPWSVLDKDTIAQPASPTVGNRYLIPAAATGTDWAGQDGKVGIYTSAGWRFATIPIGRFLYVEDETAVYHRNTSGVWTAGTGSISLGAGSVPITAIIGAKASFVIKVENQTTNTPPASPVAPVAYIVGSVPAGGWSAYSPGDLAMCLVDGTFTRIVPAAGDEVYDKAIGYNIKRNSANTAWEPAVGVQVGFARADITLNNGVANTTIVAGTNYAWSSTPPTTSNSHTRDDVGITHAAKKAGNLLIFTYRGHGTLVETVARSLGAFLLRDGLSTAIAHKILNTAGGGQQIINQQFIYAVPNTSSYTYKFGVTIHDSGGTGFIDFNARDFYMMEIIA